MGPQYHTPSSQGWDAGVDITAEKPDKVDNYRETESPRHNRVTVDTVL